MIESEAAPGLSRVPDGEWTRQAGEGTLHTVRVTSN